MASVRVYNYCHLPGFGFVEPFEVKSGIIALQTFLTIFFPTLTILLQDFHKRELIQFSPDFKKLYEFQNLLEKIYPAVQVPSFYENSLKFDIESKMMTPNQNSIKLSFFA